MTDEKKPHDGGGPERHRSPEPPSDDERRDDLTWAQVRRPAAITLVALVALVLAALVGMWSAQPRHPGADSVDAGFARELRARAHAAGVAERLRLAGHCDDMPAALLLADAVVSASTDPEASAAR